MFSLQRDKLEGMDKKNQTSISELILIAAMCAGKPLFGAAFDDLEEGNKTI